jgi:hypothetical protein
VQHLNLEVAQRDVGSGRGSQIRTASPVSGRDAGKTAGRGLPVRHRKRLLEPIGDPAASQVVGAEFDLNPIPWRDADSMQT